ncbi:MAG: DUF4258 domain-containing protein [Bacteroidetes bacterium]|nr:DUF4258 domain-containing protein [Bacteroidota bacterium]
MRKIIFSDHSLIQCRERGVTKEEVIQAINEGSKEHAKLNRLMYKMNFQFNSRWGGKFYAIKQVAPVVKENDDVIVITVYSFFF